MNVYSMTKTFIFTITMFLFMNVVMASDRISFENMDLGSVIVTNSETKSLSLGPARYIKNIIIQAEGIATASTIEVMVNGQVKGTVFAPGSDPSYVVTIAETANSIEFRHRTGGTMRVINVLATVSTWQGKPSKGHEGPLNGADNEVRKLAERTLLTLEDLNHFSQPQDEALYLFPIKKQAGLVIVYSDAKGSYSHKAILALEALQNQIDFAKTYLEGLLKNADAFDAVVDLLTVRESIEELLN